MTAISRHRLWPISKTTNRPTTSEFLQLLRTSAKFFQSAFFAILYQAFRDAPHSLWLATASRMALRLTIRMGNLRILRRACPAENWNAQRDPQERLGSVQAGRGVTQSPITGDCKLTVRVDGPLRDRGGSGGRGRRLGKIRQCRRVREPLRVRPRPGLWRPSAQCRRG